MSETPDMELDTTVAPEVVTEVELVTEPQPEAEAAAESEVASEAAAAEPETEGATGPEAGAAVGGGVWVTPADPLRASGRGRYRLCPTR